MSFTRLLGVALAALVAGMINSIAGGGTLISFPAALAAGLPAIMANATNAVALTPGSLAAAWGFRREVRRHLRLTLSLLGPALAGGLVGSVILRLTPQHLFDGVIPWLVLGATLLILLQRMIRLRHRNVPLGWVLVAQFVVGVYGGYFGAAMGIIMIALFSTLTELDAREANAVKNVLGGSINCIAAIYFLVGGLVDYRAALVMGVSASAGGYVGARLARKVSAERIRFIVVAVGLCSSVFLGYRFYLSSIR